MGLEVVPIKEVIFNRLRAVFPMQVKPPFGFTDYIGEHATGGFPRFGVDGDIYSGNDSANSDGMQGGVEFDPIGRCLTSRSLFVLHDNLIDEDGYYSGDEPPLVGDFGNPSVAWFDLVTSVSDPLIEVRPVSPGYTQIHLELKGVDPDSPDPENPDLITTLGDFTMMGVAGLPGIGCQGFTSIVNFFAPEDCSGLSPFFSLRFRVVGSGRGKIRWYAVSYSLAQGCRIGYNDEIDGFGNPIDAAWNYIDDGKVGDGKSGIFFPEAVPFGDVAACTSGEQVLEVRLIGSQLRFLFGSEDTPYVWPHPQGDLSYTPDWAIDRWMVAGGDVYGADWSVHLTKWYAGAATISNEINLGFIPNFAQLSNMTRRVHYIPSLPVDAQASNPYEVGFKPPGTGASVEHYDLNGTAYRYRLVFTQDVGGTYRGIEYSHYTAMVRAVTIDFPGQQYFFVNPPTVLGAGNNPRLPIQTVVHHSFDLATLSVRSGCELSFDNFYGVWTNWNGNGVLDANGHFAAAVNLGTYPAGTFEGAYRREFTGVMNTNFQDNWNDQGKDTVTVFGEDCSLMLDVPVWNLPWFDGWNVYYVMAYLAALGSITPAQLGFAAYVPSSPYLPSPSLPPSEQYFLPVGVAGGPVTRYSGGQKIRDIMLKISNSIGFMLYFNVFGVLQFHKFYVPPLTPYSKTFTYQSGKAFAPGLWGTDAIWAGGYSSSLKEVRNSVTVIGVQAFGPIWDPVVAHQYDNDSIFNDFAPNFKGFNDPMVWVDNIFAFPAFANAAALSMLSYLRIPDKSIHFSTWYPSGQGVYPGDVIRVINPRSAASLFPFFVTATRSTFSRDGLPRMDIEARLVPGTIFGY